MRFLCLSFAVVFGFVGLIPESGEACDRRGGSVGYAPASYGYAQPMYAPAYSYGSYYAPSGFYPQQGYALESPAPYQSFYPPSVAPPTAMPTAPATTTDVTASDDKFAPATLTIAPGTTVRWTNKGSHKHTVTSATGAWDSGDLATDQTFTATFTRTGTFEYFCRHHKDMKGTIVVK
jgi:plastocyanin